MCPCLTLCLLTYFLPHVSCLRRSMLPYSTLFSKTCFHWCHYLSIPPHTCYHSCTRPQLAFLQYAPRGHLLQSPNSPQHAPIHLSNTFIWELTIFPKASIHMTACLNWAGSSKNRKPVSPAFISRTPRQHTPQYELFPAHSGCSTNICWAKPLT